MRTIHIRTSDVTSDVAIFLGGCFYNSVINVYYISMIGQFSRPFFIVRRAKLWTLPPLLDSRYNIYLTNLVFSLVL